MLNRKESPVVLFPSSLQSLTHVVAVRDPVVNTELWVLGREHGIVSGREHRTDRGGWRTRD